MIPATPPETFKSEFAKYKRGQSLFGLVADQSPSDPSKAYWLNFFHRPTAFIRGPERGARLDNLPVLFACISKPRRGYYHAVFSLAEENPNRLSEGELTVRFARYLEEVIRKYPDMWLWSHRRWKLEWKPGYEKLWVDNSNPL
jgi:KDO2-lipid IV(A) lauroyltransferase